VSVSCRPTSFPHNSAIFLKLLEYALDNLEAEEVSECSSSLIQARRQEIRTKCRTYLDRLRTYEKITKSLRLPFDMDAFRHLRSSALQDVPLTSPTLQHLCDAYECW
jgi:hypothetical protein